MLGSTLDHLTRQALQEAVDRHHGVVAAAARQVGISQSYFRRLAARLGVQLPVKVHVPVPAPPPGRASLRRCSMHDWLLVHRARNADGILRIWHCRKCPAVRQEGPR